jgi:NitT/TauT family transport system substrate-binding protein
VIGAQAMVAGDLDFLYGACTEMMTARKGGMDIVVLVATSESNIYTIASRPGITDPKQLVGKRVAVNTLGDTSHLSARFALKQAGVDPDSVTYVQVGNTPARLAARQSGAVEAALQSAQNVGIVKNLGMNILINLFEQRIPYCASALGVSKSFLRTNPQTVEAFVRGLIKGNAFIREGNPDGVKAIMGKYMKLPVTDKRLVDAYNFYATQYNLKYPGLTLQGIAFIIEQMAMRDKSWLEWKPEQFYDTSVIDRLKREGFLEQVYREIR